MDPKRYCSRPGGRPQPDCGMPLGTNPKCICSNDLKSSIAIALLLAATIKRRQNRKRWQPLSVSNGPKGRERLLARLPMVNSRWIDCFGSSWHFPRFAWHFAENPWTANLEQWIFPQMKI